MQNYDEIINFNYLNLDDWKNYAKKYIIPLFQISDVFLKLRNSLEGRLKNNAKEEFNSNENIREILLGGVSEQGNYESNSLARIYKRSLGIKIPRYDWIYYKRLGLEPFDQGVKCEFNDTVFLFFVEKIKIISSEILRLLSIQESQPNDDLTNILGTPERILDFIKDFYVSILNFSANYNQQTFFVINTYCSLKFYLIKAYPKLEGSFHLIKEFLGLEEKVAFSIDTDENGKDYTIWGHSEEGLADKIYELQQLLEEFFNFTTSSIDIPEQEKFYSRDKFNYLIELVIQNPVNLRKEYYNRVKESIDLSSELNFPPFSVSIQGYDKELQLVVRKNKIIKITNGYSPRTRYAFSLWRTKIILTEFLEKVAPYLFLAIATLSEIENLSYSEILDTDELNQSRFLKFYNRIG